MEVLFVYNKTAVVPGTRYRYTGGLGAGRANGDIQRCSCLPAAAAAAGLLHCIVIDWLGRLMFIGLQSYDIVSGQTTKIGGKS